MKYEFNKSNWSGENMTINVRKSDGSFEMYGYRIGVAAPENPVDGQAVPVTIDGRSADFNVYFDAKRNVWEALHMDITRQDAVPQVAAAKMLANTL